ncbi:MAG: OmpA family protein [Pseudomonadota bacterium]
MMHPRAYLNVLALVALVLVPLTVRAASDATASETGQTPAARLGQGVDPFEHGWTLDEAASVLRFATVKNQQVAESNRFATLAGSISNTGRARLKIDLESVDTGIDIRNVRLRFMFFETFLYRNAEVTTDLDPSVLAELARTPRLTVTQRVNLSLHGAELAFEVPLRINLVDFDRVEVSSSIPLPVQMDPFDLDAGRNQLENAANVAILPLVFVTFDLVFQRNRPGTRPPSAQATEVAAQSGPMSRPECMARVSALSRLSDIAFADTTANLAPRSDRTLDRLREIAGRCAAYRIEIGGHTDDTSGADDQRRLSRARAQAVADALTREGIQDTQLVVVGYGSSRPIVPNTTEANRSQNNRIEFRLLN